MSAGAAAYTTKRGKTKKGKLGQRKDAQSNNERRLTASTEATQAFFAAKPSQALGLLSTSEINARRTKAHGNATKQLEVGASSSSTGASSSSTSTSTTSSSSNSNEGASLNETNAIDVTGVTAATGAASTDTTGAITRSLSLLVVDNDDQPNRHTRIGKPPAPVKSILHDRMLFPPYTGLPDEAYIAMPTEPYYDEEDGAPVCTWTFLAEIVEDGHLMPRHLTIVRDVSGQEVCVAFYVDNDEGEDTFDYALLRKGHTLCVRYAHQHTFMDNQEGLRIEECEFVHVIKAPLQQVIDAADLLTQRRDMSVFASKCFNPSCTTGRAAEKKCSQCSMAGNRADLHML